ncbi:high affinity 3',5'-cyclic-AMP phosphodiesterase 7A-like isoform X2 [Tachypleus tridentatus]|uniref:high affinity 3',5'-cyclic-AMP phosphodiesterase 7A-like isoform X2 n=1 Tax=Tachypleus tridentatus TaxID=6853 RepID=UPI003FD4250D
MIPYATCVCTRTRQNTQKWFAKTTIGQSRVELEREKNGKVCVRLRALNASGNERPLAAKPFLTLQRHRVRFPVTKPEVQQLHILDDSYDGVIQYLLSSCWKWNFNAFSLDVATGGRSLSVLLLHLFHHYGFTKTFHLDALKILHCFTLVESGYHRDNPYHNAVHAADVTQALHCFLQEETISKYLTPVEIMACLIAAVCHDLDHPGFTQPFLLATSNHLAVLYKNFSVLETHHWRMAISCLRESKLLDHMDKDVCEEIERSVQSLILSTDLSLQQDFLISFKKSMDEISLDLNKKEKRHFVLQVALKCADLCNPCRPWPISKQWSYQVCEELFKQGDVETELCLPVTPICDRTRTSVARIQSDFLRYVVSPLFVMWHQFLKSSLSQELMRNLRSNQARWNEQLQRELAELDDMSSMMGIAAMASDEFAPLASEEEDSLEDCVSLYNEGFLVVHSSNTSLGRRHSEPLRNIISLPGTAFRRESYPQSLVSHFNGTRIPPHLRYSANLSSEVAPSTLLQSRTSIVSLSSPLRSLASRRLEDEVANGRTRVSQQNTLPSTSCKSSSPLTNKEAVQSQNICLRNLVRTSYSPNERTFFSNNSSETDCDNKCSGLSTASCPIESNNEFPDSEYSRMKTSDLHNVNKLSLSRTLFSQETPKNCSLLET